MCPSWGAKHLFLTGRDEDESMCPFWGTKPVFHAAWEQDASLCPYWGIPKLSPPCTVEGGQEESMRHY
jgi:hypothetical protein